MPPTVWTQEDIKRYHSESKEERQTRMEEVVRRGKEIYETSLRAQLEPENVGKFLLIETTTGEYELVSGQESLTRRLHELGPGPTRFQMLIGYVFRDRRRYQRVSGAVVKTAEPHQRNGV